MKIASLVITTHNRPKYLELCLDNLLHQNFDSELYEIIIVDSYSKTKNENIRVVQAFQKKSKVSLKYFYNSINGGLTLSRNMAVLNSSADIIIQVDDDSLVESNYVEESVRSLVDNNADMVIGKMLPKYEFDPPIKIIKKITKKIYDGYYIPDLSVLDYGVTVRIIPPHLAFCTNSCYRKSFFINSGGIGPDGFSSPYMYWNGSGEHNYTIHAEKIVYAPSIVSHHIISKERFKPGYFYSRSFFYGVGDSFSSIQFDFSVDKKIIFIIKNIAKIVKNLCLVIVP